VFESRNVRRVYGFRRRKSNRSLKKLHNEKLHNLYSSPAVVRGIKSRKETGGKIRNVYTILA
jgi:hypothetical protein